MSNQEPSFEYQKWVHELRRHDAERAHDQIDEFHRYVNEATIKTGELALRMAMLINGGAAIALLAFIGGLAAKDNKVGGWPQLSHVAEGLTWFAFGVVFSVAGMALAYLTNYSIVRHAASHERLWEPPFVKPGPTTKRWRSFNIVFHGSAVLLGLASVGAFVGGMLTIKAAILKLF